GAGANLRGVLRQGAGGPLGCACQFSETTGLRADPAEALGSLDAGLIEWNDAASAWPWTPHPGPLTLRYSGGVRGGSRARPGKANLRLIRRAIRADWDFPAEKRQALVDHLEAVVLNGHPCNAIAVAGCPLKAVKA